MVTTRFDLLHNEIEWRRCKNDVAYFAEKYCWIKHSDPGRGPIKIPLRPEQREVLEMWSEGQHTISLKARQIGWSTIVCIFALHMALFNEASTIVLLSKKQDDAEDMLEKCVFSYQRLPDWMLKRVTRNNRAVKKMTFTNDSKIEALPSRKDPARSKSASLIVLDEWAFYEDPENAWAAIKPAVDVGGHVIALSTANGAGNFFHRFWKKAVAGQNGFKALFYSWRVVPERDDAWYENEKMSTEPWILAQEYPNNPQEAFVVSGSPAFDTEKLIELSPRQYRQGWLHERGNSIRFQEAGNGNVYILHEPEPRRFYAIGGDVAAGTATGDYSSATVLDVETGEQVARWHGRINVDLFADELFRLGTFYNQALLAPERNGVGGALVQSLVDMGYPNLYEERRPGITKVARDERKFGWQTTAGNKYQLVMAMTQALRDGSLVPTHEATINELLSFRHTKQNKFEGDPNDDEVMSMGIAWQVLPFARPAWLDREDRIERNNPMRVSNVLAEIDRERGRGGRGRIGNL